MLNWMIKTLVLLVPIFFFARGGAQVVEVQYNYNSTGDCIFDATNYLNTPVYISIDFADLQNATFHENLPYVKKLVPGFNSLFVLTREGDDVPRFNYQLKTYRSNPFAQVDLDFPYLIPFAPGEKVQPVEVKTIQGFMGEKEPGSWVATGFRARPGQKVYAARQGEIMEVAGATRSEDTKSWYNTWTNVITLLQPDGTLICYKNVVDPGKKLNLNQKLQAGEVLGEIAPGAKELVLLVYYNVFNSGDLNFIIPQFLTSPGKVEILNASMTIDVVHPPEVRGLEMTKKERKRYLKN